MNTFDLFQYGWEGEDTVCGWGSRLENTTNVIQDLTKIINLIDKNIVKINDAGCGDLWWWRTISEDILKKIDYVGYDLYPKPSWKTLDFKCEQLNICQQLMRQCDLIICRDVFIHWPNKYILQALSLFKKSGKYLYSTMYTGEYMEFTNNNRIQEFSLRHSKLNLCSPPFNLGIPIFITKENYNTDFCKKVICLWKI